MYGDGCWTSSTWLICKSSNRDSPKFNRPVLYERTLGQLLGVLDLWSKAKLTWASPEWPNCLLAEEYLSVWRSSRFKSFDVISQRPSDCLFFQIAEQVNALLLLLLPSSFQPLPRPRFLSPESKLLPSHRLTKLFLSKGRFFVQRDKCFSFQLQLHLFNFWKEQIGTKDANKFQPQS